MKVKIQGLSFSYKDHKVLEDLSFCVGDGELVCVLGPNGVGKSTLFRCLLGIQKGYTGKIFIDERESSQIPPKDMAKYLAYIPQYSTPVFAYTVFQMVLMGTTAGMGLFSHPGKKQEKKALDALKLLGIEHLREKCINEISGGERQLVLIARAIAQNARILVMDEPTANLDYGNQVRVMQMIQKLARQGYSVVMSTHNPDQAFLYGSRVLVLKSGRILSQGPPGEALSEEILSKVYGVEVSIQMVPGKEQDYYLCVPGKRRCV